jgi:D-hydroxyproline dehydrogenase subunit gamma
MFRRVHAPRAPITVFVDDKVVSAETGDTVAAVLLSAGVLRLRRSAISSAVRAPYCLMGVCFECLVEIDGVPERQACLVPVQEGMHVRTHVK